MSEPLIKLENVWKVYQLGSADLNILKGVNLEVSQGSFTSIMGSSGSGKSTLLHIIGCLDVPSEGKVFFGNQDISELTEDQLAKIRGKRVGFVFQQFNLIRNLNSLENVMLPMVFQEMPEKERQERSEKLLLSLNLGERIYHKPSELSGGEQQRVAIARALANDPEIIVADEPTGNLDSSTGKMIMEILAKLHQEERKTIIVVTHDPVIAKYSENVINIKDGQIISNHRQSEQILWDI